MSGFDTTPKPAFLLAMQNQKWTPAGAFSEFVDNGFGKGRGDANTVFISHDQKNRMIQVLDNGRGMDQIGRLFQLGNTIGRTPGDIGLYGSGGTMALLWLGKAVEIWTLRAGRVNHDRVIWKHYFKADSFPVISDEWKQANISNTPTELLEAGHGTLIRIQLLDERVFYRHNVQRDLASTFAPAIRHGKQLFWYNVGGKDAGEIALSDGFPDFAKADSVSFDLTIDVRGEFLSVHGRVGIIDDLPQIKSVVHVGFGPRTIIRTRDCYSSRDGAEKFIGTGVTGWLDLGEGWQPFLSTTKDEINDKPVWDELMGYVFEQIRPILSKVDKKQLAAEFDDLALHLQTALNGKSKLEISVTVDRSRDSGNDVRGDGQAGDGDSSRNRKAQESEAGQESKTKQSAISEIVIVPVSDAEMQGALCSAEFSSDQVIVSVNADHNVVQLAMKSRPINRMALNLMITREMAAEIAADPQLVKRLFNQKICEQIDSLAEKERPRFIARLLMDRVRDAPEMDEAA